MIQNLLTQLANKFSKQENPSRTIPGLPYHPVVLLPQNTKLLDLSKKPTNPPVLWSIGRYNEVRAIYTQPRFNTPDEQPRNVHIGIDLGAPAGVAVHAFWDGKVIATGENTDAGDYGPVIITEHQLSATTTIYALHGHLSRASLQASPVNRSFKRGEVLGWLGAPTENGGWPPHVHFQLSFIRPKAHDMPGVVALKDREQALRDYPDPRNVMQGVRLRANI